MSQEEISADSRQDQCQCRWCTGALPSRPCMPLYTDVIRVMIGFLTCSELHTAVQISHQWYQVVKTTKPLGLTANSSKLFMIFPNSTVASHVSIAKQVVFVCEKYPAFIRLLSERLPNLTQVYGARHVSKKILQLSETPLQLPLRLQTLDLTFDFDCAKSVGTSISSLSQLHTLLLSITDDSNNRVRTIDFSTFLPHQLPHLKNLALSFRMFAVSDELDNENPFFPSALVEFVRQSSLVDLFINDLDANSLSNLLDQISSDIAPCPIMDGKLSLIGLSSRKYRYQPVLLRSLLKFPSIRTIGHLCLTSTPEDTQLLSQFHNLTNLELWSEPARQSTPESVIAACKYAPRITGLLIELESFTEQHLREAVSFLPQLNSLELVACGNLRGLAPLKEFGLPERLMRFEVWCAKLPVSSATDVIFCLKKLQKLRLESTFSEPMPMDLQLQFEPNSPTCKLPNLVEMSFSL